MNESNIDKDKISKSTVLELEELGRQIPAAVRADLVRRLDNVIGQPQTKIVLLSH